MGKPWIELQVTIARKRSGKKATVKYPSPEEKTRTRCLAKAMKEIEKNYKKAIEKAEKTYSKELKKAALKMEKAIANAASKKDAALQRNQSEEAQKASMEAYERAVLEAKTECETQSTNALGKKPW